MSDFWENVLRFPRFFISSTLGLILIIIGPFFNLLKRPQTSLLLFLIVSVTIFFLIFTLKAMLNLDIN
jgi:hypothetical protein